MIGLIVLTASFDLAPHILSRESIGPKYLLLSVFVGLTEDMVRLGSSSACHIVILPAN
uniref:Uncharacterized protein n=1 Tax=Setaria viridis TaxID=4556 RepID=A0A4U6URC3_SETVI|nr:hypothetical protein SEVIR_5G464650v2 [Setaria viridis]